MMKTTTFTAYLIIVSILSSCLTKSTTSENEHPTIGDADVSTEIEVKKEEDSFIAYFSDEIELDGFKSCAYGTYEETNKLFTPTIIDTYDLVKLDVDEAFEQVLKKNYLDALYFPIAKKKMGEIYVLLYGLTYDKNDVYAREYRILIFKNDTILQNILFSASIASEGENNLCRELKVYPNRIELINENSENVEYLNLPDTETHYFKPKAQEISLDLSDYAGTTQQLVMRHYNSGEQFVLLLDDIMIEANTLNVSDPDANIRLTVYPNPAKDFVKINTRKL